VVAASLPQAPDMVPELKVHLVYCTTMFFGLEAEKHEVGARQFLDELFQLRGRHAEAAAGVEEGVRADAFRLDAEQVPVGQYRSADDLERPLVAARHAHRLDDMKRQDRGGGERVDPVHRLYPPRPGAARR